VAGGGITQVGGVAASDEFHGVKGAATVAAFFNDTRTTRVVESGNGSKLTEEANALHFVVDEVAAQEFERDVLLGGVVGGAND